MLVRRHAREPFQQFVARRAAHDPSPANLPDSSVFQIVCTCRIARACGRSR